MNKLWKNKLLFLPGFIFILISISILLYLLISQKNGQNPSLNNTSQTINPDNLRPKTNLNLSKNKLSSMPKISFDSLNLESSVLQLPQKISSYSLKTDFSQEEIIAFGEKLHLSQTSIKNSKNYIGLIKNSNEEISVLLFNSLNGTFLFRSTGLDLTVNNTSSSDLSQKAKEIVSNLGLGNENTILCNSSYKLKDSFTKITYIECHRDWQRMGLPILNTVGLLNLPENQKLADLEAGKTSSFSPDDKSIFISSDGSTGKKRPNDFNTLTISFNDSTGKVTSIESNLRWIQSGSEMELKDIVSPNIAYDLFSKNEYKTSAVLPSGKGSIDLNNVYPQETAKAKTATVTDFTLFYPDIPFTPIKEYQPYYLIRGTAYLESGYNTKFVEILPASSKEMSSYQQFGEPQVAGVSSSSDQSDRGQKQGTFNFPSPTPCPPGYTEQEGQCILIKWDNPTATPVPQNNTPPPSQPQPTTPPCQDTCGICLESTFNIEGATFGINPEDNQYYIIPNTTDEATLRSQITALINQIVGDDPHHPLREQIEEIVKGLSSFTTPNGCPQRVTGASPSIFIYSKNTSTLVIPDFKTTYSDPPLENEIWEMKNSLINGLKREFIYYLYFPEIKLSSDKGWVVDKKNIKKFINKTCQSISLNEDECDRLDFEINSAIKDSSADKFFISLLPETLINEKLPFKTVPEIKTVYRYNFSISNHIPNKIEIPEDIKKIDRSNDMIIELGAFLSR